MALLTKHPYIQINEKNAFSVPPSSSTIVLVLTANTPVDLTIGTDLVDADGVKPTYINFAGLKDFFVGWNTTGQTVPGASILDGTAPEINPGMRSIAGYTSLSVVAAYDTTVQLGLYRGQ
jgi:hypothetical protein